MRLTISKFVENISKNRLYKSLRLKQYVLFAVLIICLVVIVVTLAHVTKSGNKPRTTKSKVSDTGKINIELATKSVSGDELWRNHLEEKIVTEKSLREEQLDIINKSIVDKETKVRIDQSNELKTIKATLEATLQALERLKSDHTIIKEELSMLNAKPEEILPANLSITTINSEDDISPPVDSWNYIPSTSYVSGHLLGGIAVSTSVSSAAQPIPVIIRLKSRGNLPKDFAVDIKQCRLLGSAYGDISSERAIIRAEELVCEDMEEQTVTTTRVAGIIYGDDGMNGIRGNVVSMSDKHLKNAFLGGVLSGFSRSAKSQDGLSISSLGAISTKDSGIKDTTRNGLLEGSSTAAEKLADYHIRLAENISPVILIPGGTRVDVMFTKGVYIGSTDVQDRIINNRDNNRDKDKKSR